MTDSIKGMAAANGSALQQRTAYYMSKSATAVIGEDGATPGHALRLAYAQTVLAGTASVPDYAIAVVSNSTVIASVPDNGDVNRFRAVPVWTALASFSLDDLVRPSTFAGRVYRCTVAGISGASEPTWSATVGNTTVDATATWTAEEGGISDADLEFTVNSLWNDFAGYDG
ncbi:MAG: hypothetical protein ACPGVG_13400 [Mycobacterium sp.]